MAYLNKVMLMGNLGKDAEVRITQTNKKRASFSLATTRKYKDPATGELKDDTTWHNIVAWDRLAERIEKLAIRKGTPLYVEGKIMYRAWNDPQTGQPQKVTEILMDSFEFLAPKQSYEAPADTYSVPARPSFDSNTDFNSQNMPPPSSDPEDQMPF